MQFVLRRDEEGRERIYVGDVCAGFWEMEWRPVPPPTRGRRHEVTVDVPVADFAAPSAEEGDES